MWNQIKTILLLGVLTTLLVGIGGLLGPGYAILFGGLALLINVGAYFFSDKLLLAMHGAKVVDRNEAPLLHEMVEELSANAGIPKPKICIVPAPYANAFATGRNPRHGVVAVTEGLLQVLDTRELRGVIAHEIAHIKNRDILIATIAAVLAGTLTSLGQSLLLGSIFQSGDDEEESGWGALGLGLVAPLAGTVLQMAISRSREFLADATGAEIAGDPEGLARALERLHEAAAEQPAAVNPATASLYIVSPLVGTSIANLFATHPPVEQRIARLRGERAQRRSWAALVPHTDYRRSS